MKKLTIGRTLKFIMLFALKLHCMNEREEAYNTYYIFPHLKYYQHENL